MSLSDLPDEILNLISIRLNGFDNCSLWMASDSILRQRLVNNVITDFDINYRIPGRYLWPGNFLKKLQKLSRLSLVVDSELYHLPIHNIEIFPIPSLKFLKLNFNNVLQNHLISSNNSVGPRTSLEYINLDDFYPDLEHLEIIGRLSASTLKIDFLGFLPQKLKALLISRTFIEIDSNPNDLLNTHIQLLPRTLTELQLTLDHRFEKMPYLDFSRLPPNFTSLSMNFLLHEESYQMIPNSLKKITMNTSNIQKLSPFLPIGLESLSINITGTPPTSDMFHRLENLENLENLSLRSIEPVHFNDFIRNCPAKLKQFSCNNAILTDLVVPKTLFNNCLTSLEMDDVIGISAEFISSLPQTLTHLLLYVSDHMLPEQQPFAFFSALPRKLQSIYANLAIIEKTSLLPESLTCLSLSAAPESDDASCFDRLPSKLETLKIEKKIPKSIIKQLPTTLKTLDITSDQAIDDETVRMLPRGLEHLSINSQDDITDVGVADLPPCLKSLALYYNTKITDHGISSLPKGLMYLTQPRNPNFTDECIKHLPPRLTYLYFGQVTEITSNSCKDLPKYLQCLFLPHCKNWDPEMLIASKNELPQYIKRIDLRNMEASKQWKKIISSNPHYQT